jgi:hypothetical protein
VRLMLEVLAPVAHAHEPHRPSRPEAGQRARHRRRARQVARPASPSCCIRRRPADRGRTHEGALTPARRARTTRRR